VRLNYIWVSVFLFALIACGSRKADTFRNEDGSLVNGARRAEAHDGTLHLLSGGASYYAKRFNGRKTASGEVYSSNKFTAAHRTLPFGTIVRVVDPQTNRSVRVRINDRGPFSEGRVIDLSSLAAADLDMVRRGVIHVELLVLEWPN